MAVNAGRQDPIELRWIGTMTTFIIIVIAVLLLLPEFFHGWHDPS
jgi:hypothetical protein